MFRKINYRDIFQFIWDICLCTVIWGIGNSSNGGVGGREGTIITIQINNDLVEKSFLLICLLKIN